MTREHRGVQQAATSRPSRSARPTSPPRPRAASGWTQGSGRRRPGAAWARPAPGCRRPRRRTGERRGGGLTTPAASSSGAHEHGSEARALAGPPAREQPRDQAGDGAGHEHEEERFPAAALAFSGGAVRRADRDYGRVSRAQPAQHRAELACRRLTQPFVGPPVWAWRKIPEPRPGTTGRMLNSITARYG